MPSACASLPALCAMTLLARRTRSTQEIPKLNPELLLLSDLLSSGTQFFTRKTLKFSGDLLRGNLSIQLRRTLPKSLAMGSPKKDGRRRGESLVRLWRQ